jgi:transglutaminase-like putative cysteine protease
LLVEPEPVDRRQASDPYQNPVVYLTFAATSAQLRIESRCELDTIPVPPLDTPDLAPLPWLAPTCDELSIHRATVSTDESVLRFALELASQVGHSPLAFLDHLSGALYTRTERHIRPSGAARPPGETLASGRGACRDLTLLFMAACRSLGMASRFVSGYQAAADTPDGRRHLHAWPEVFLPGIGWRGFDPTHGIAVGEGHVALCAAPDQAGTMPVEGTYGFVGEHLTSTLDYSLTIATR